MLRRAKISLTPPAPSPREERGSKTKKILVPLSPWERG